MKHDYIVSGLHLVMGAIMTTFNDMQNTAIRLWYVMETARNGAPDDDRVLAEARRLNAEHAELYGFELYDLAELERFLNRLHHHDLGQISETTPAAGLRLLAGLGNWQPYLDQHISTATRADQQFTSRYNVAGHTVMITTNRKTKQTTIEVEQ